MIKRRRQPPAVGTPLSVHMVKEQNGKVVVTKCGVIADTSSRQPVPVTKWNSEVTCTRCVAAAA